MEVEVVREELKVEVEVVREELKEELKEEVLYVSSSSLAALRSSAAPLSSMFSSESSRCSCSCSVLRLASWFCSGNNQGFRPGWWRRFHSGYFRHAL